MRNLKKTKKKHLKGRGGVQASLSRRQKSYWRKSLGGWFETAFAGWRRIRPVGENGETTL